MTHESLRQAYCSRPECVGGAKVGRDCPLKLLCCLICGSRLSFTDPLKLEPADGEAR